jgi:hypothetical protein
MTVFGLGTQTQPDPLPTATAAAHAEMRAVLNRGSSWLFWIGGLSLVNTVVMLSGSSWVFLAGLGITEFAAAITHNAGGTARLIAILINTGAAAFFIALGLFARKGLKWAFLTGITFYALDSLVVVLFQAWLMLAFHGYILYRLWTGYRMCSELHAFEKAKQENEMAATVGRMG